MPSSFVISQILVGGALICNLLSFQFKKRTVVLWILTLAVLLVSGQLYFLGQITSALLTLYAVLYFLVSTKTTNRVVMFLFMAGGFAIFLLNYASYLDWFFMVSTVITLLSIYNSNQKRMREYQFAGTIIRIIYYVIIFSPIGILLEGALFVSNALSYYRFYIRKQSGPSATITS